MRLATMLLASGILAAAPALAFTVDGTLDGAYGPALHTQTTQTDFGNATDGQPGFTNGSELDVAHGTIDGNVLRLFLGGNLESNFNKLEIFIDCLPGGQNRLRGDNPNVDFDGLNRMGDDGSGNGLTFDAGFEADFYITMTNGDAGGHAIFANYAELLTGGGGSGYYLGQTTAQNGTLSGGINPHGIELTLDNSNVGGVDAGCGASSGAGVTTGIELAIPLSALGNAQGCFKVSVFVNGGGHDFVSNQVLGSLPPGTCNLGEPRNVNFNSHAGDQYFTVCDNPTHSEKSSWGRVKAMYR
jgi:hypothetical protein